MVDVAALQFVGPSALVQDLTTNIPSHFLSDNLIGSLIKPPMFWGFDFTVSKTTQITAPTQH